MRGALKASVKRRAADLAALLEARIRSASPSLADLLELAFGTIESEPARIRHAGFIPCWIRERIGAAAARHPESGNLYARWLLAILIERAEPSSWPIALPNSVASLLDSQFDRILADIEPDNARVSQLDDAWLKNFAIASGCLLPVGAEFAAIDSGIPRSTLFRGSIAQRISLLRTVIFGTHGFYPLLDLHAHPHYLENFNPDGWIQTYHRLAELLAINPCFKGVMASSWFRDPVLATISPRLSYLREFPLKQGAAMFAIAHDHLGESGALARSATRRHLFNQGLYIPTIWMMVWPRRNLLAWHVTSR